MRTAFLWTVAACSLSWAVACGSSTSPSDGHSDGLAGAHAFPYGFDDQTFFANVTDSGPITLDCETRADLSITSGAGSDGGDAAITNGCGDAASTLSRVRLGGDGGTHGTVREGYRCAGHGTMNIESSWLESQGMGADHADSLQCYDPDNTPTAVMNLKNTTIRAHDTAATAGIFVADAYSLELHVTDVLFWGGPFGLRFHTDGRPGSLYMNNVCFYGTGASDQSFGTAPYLMDPFPPTIVEWNNVQWCTIENDQVVMHGAIAQP